MWLTLLTLLRKDLGRLLRCWNCFAIVILLFRVLSASSKLGFSLSSSLPPQRVPAPLPSSSLGLQKLLSSLAFFLLIRHVTFCLCWCCKSLLIIFFYELQRNVIKDSFKGLIYLFQFFFYKPISTCKSFSNFERCKLNINKVKVYFSRPVFTSMLATSSPLPAQLLPMTTASAQLKPWIARNLWCWLVILKFLMQLFSPVPASPLPPFFLFNNYLPFKSFPPLSMNNNWFPKGREDTLNSFQPFCFHLCSCPPFSSLQMMGR